MKRLILATAAALVLTGSAALADPYNHGHYQPPRNVAHVDYRHHEWRAGERLPAEWRRGPAVNWRYYHLRQPPRGYYWVRAHNDFVLVARSNGIILDLAFAR